MSQVRLSNADFLNTVLGDKGQLPDYLLLPHEQAQVRAAHNENVTEFQKIVESKVSVTGGDDWHDGAFRTTDNEARVAAERNAAIAPFLGAVIVEYPLPQEVRVTIGSRVFVEQKSYTFPVDIVGFRQGYPSGVVDKETGEEIIGISPDSPLGQAILGKETGESTEYRNGERIFQAIIARIDQEAVRSQFAELLED